METGRDDGVDALGWGNAGPDATDDDTQENVEEGQIREAGQPSEYEREHQGEEREPGA